MLSALQVLVRECTALQPEDRPTMQQVLDRVRHLQKLCNDMRAAGAAATGAAASGSTGS